MRLEERLRMSEACNDGSSFFWAQWLFDKALLTRSLNVINTVFPHYSLHESSHSLSIVSEIEKVLGRNVENLSFVDTWLLLEAAYWHDIGMIIPHEEKLKIIEQVDFRNFIEEIATSGNDHSEYAKIYSSYLHGITNHSILDLEKSFTFLLSEFIRRKHPDRSKHFLLNPDYIGIKTPDTGLINSRLFELLGDIIVCHGRDFHSVLELPFENDGLAVGDIAHPRFVASLLRLGDLLDLDDGRHCPTQLVVIGKLPELSQAHLEKHRSIVSKNVSEFSIEIKAKCQNFDSFELQNDWFSYLEQEIQNQDRLWGKIAPKNYIGKLPMINGLICELEGSVSMSRNSSRLSLDTNRIYDFLTGKSIYENPLASIHEILQNAVDATIDRIWLENQENIKTISDFNSKTKNHPIKIEVNSHIIQPDKVEYLIEVIDSGKGMSFQDIQSILTIASNKNQEQKKSTRSGMPSWMLPSGFFGIGLQSVFSISNEITIKTHSANDTPYEIIIRATKGKTPSFVVKRISSNRWKFGTSVMFKIIDDAIPNRISGHSSVAKTLARFDPLQDDILNAKTAQIEEQVAEFSKYCQFPIFFNKIILTNNKDSFKICDEENGIEYIIEFSQRSHFSEWQFRGRPFKSTQYYKYINVIGNIISEHADTFLPLSREKIHNEGRILLEKKLMNSIFSKRDDILTIIKNHKMADFFYFINGKENDNSWKEIEIFGKPLGEQLEIEKPLKVTFDNIDRTNIEVQYREEIIHDKNNEVSILIDAAIRSGLGVSIEKIEYVKATDKQTSENPYNVTVYHIKFVANKSLSFISPSAIKYLSDDKLDDSRARYWLPCGSDIDKTITIPNQYQHSWIMPLTPFCDFFEKGIILRSTSTSLEADLPILIREIKKFNYIYTESQIETALRNFYDSYDFNHKPGFFGFS